MANKKYHIQCVDNCFLVKKTGSWDLSTDLQYISELADALVKRQGNAFYLIVDMRGLQVPDDVKHAKQRYPVILDRRNQLGEIWLLDDPQQSSHLLTYFEHVRFELQQTTQRDAFLQWLSARLTPRTLQAVTRWLDEKIA